MIVKLEHHTVKRSSNLGTMTQTKFQAPIHYKKMLLKTRQKDG